MCPITPPSVLKFVKPFGPPLDRVTAGLWGQHGLRPVAVVSHVASDVISTGFYGNGALIPIDLQDVADENFTLKRYLTNILKCAS